MEPKKISFGFSRIQKKQDSVALAKVEDKKQFIDCLEEKSIKLKNHIEDDEKPLVIPLKNNSTTAASLLRMTSEIATSGSNFESKIETSHNELLATSELYPKENLEQQAARELLEEATDIKKKEVKVNTIPISDIPTLSGEKESNLEDYESIPVTDFGLAMLRGMGWQPGKGIGKRNESVELALPKVRPKGMGLGADKAPKAEITNGDRKQPEGEELKIVKGTSVKIISGKKAGSYGQISGFDEDSGRMIVKMAISGENVNISEFMVEPVTKDEYNRNSRILNGAKYEIYKRKEEDDRRHKHRQRDDDKQKYEEQRKDNIQKRDDQRKYDDRHRDETRRRDDDERRKYDYDRRTDDDRRRKEDRRRRDR